MAYKFIDTNEASLKSYASIQTIINGFNLDTELCGYRTLNVSGRSAFGRDIDTLKYTASKNAGSKSTRSKAGGIGTNKFFGSSAQGVEIEVQYELKAKTNELFRELLSDFVRILHQEEAEWSWTDDPEFYYTGTLSEFERFKEDRNSIISTFKIICVDPLKTSKELYKINGNGRQIYIPDTKHEIEVLHMQFILKEAGKSFRFSNSWGYGECILNKTFKAGDKIEVFFETNTITINGLSGMLYLDLNSDLEGFFIVADEYVDVSIPCDCEIRYKLRSY